MSIPQLHSITEITPADCYQTAGSRPVRVLCNDLNYYICKYHTSTGFSSQLFNEYIAARFLQIWQLPVPEFVFVNTKPEHLKLTQYPFHYFEKPCFGSKFLGEHKEVDKFFIETPLILKAEKSAIIGFLIIGLFDIWLCNDDRHYENFNLLYNITAKQFVPIDHAACFNGNNLGKPPYLISSNESILSSPFLFRFFDRNLHRNFNQLLLELKQDFKTKVNLCHEKLHNILSDVPLAWQPDLNFLITGLESYFTNEWLKSCFDYFTELCILNTKNIK